MGCCEYLLSPCGLSVTVETARMCSRKICFNTGRSSRGGVDDGVHKRYRGCGKNGPMVPRVGGLGVRVESLREARLQVAGLQEVHERVNAGGEHRAAVLILRIGLRPTISVSASSPYPQSCEGCTKGDCQ